MTPYEKHIRINRLKQDYQKTWQDFDTWEIRLDMSHNPFSDYGQTECMNMIWALNDELTRLETELRKFGIKPEDIHNG